MYTNIATCDLASSWGPPAGRQQASHQFQDMVPVHAVAPGTGQRYVPVLWVSGVRSGQVLTSRTKLKHRRHPALSAFEAGHGSQPSGRSTEFAESGRTFQATCTRVRHGPSRETSAYAHAPLPVPRPLQVPIEARRHMVRLACGT